MDLSTPNTRQKYLLKTKCLNFFSLQATAVDRCERVENVPNIALHKNCGNQTNREWCGLPRTAYSSVSSLSLNDEKWQFPLHLLPTRFTIFSLCYIHRLWLANFRQATEYLLDSGLLLTMQLCTQHGTSTIKNDMTSRNF